MIAPHASADVRDAARALLTAGIQVVPVRPGTKRPYETDWTTRRLSPEEIDQAFQADSNIGIILGEPSDGLVDVDLDCEEARRIAAELLPHTRLIHGRESSPRSHYWYRVSDPGPVQRLKDPVSGETLVELRSTGGQTIIPPSRHPSGEPLFWHESDDPGASTYGDLFAVAKRIAALALLAREWKRGSRHDTAMALSGFLLRRGVPTEEAEEIVQLVANAAQDEELSSRVRAVRDTAAKLQSGHPTTGGSTLLGLLDSKTIVKLEEWLGLDRSSCSQESAWDPPAVLGTIERADFPTASLPSWLRAWVHAESVATQTPPDLAGMLVLTVCASAIAKKVSVRISESWTEPTNLYCVVVLAPGNRKSVVYADATRPLLEHEASELSRLEPEIAQAESRHRVAVERLREAEKAAAKADAQTRKQKELAVSRLVDELGAMRVPARPRYIVDDCTPEQLATILQEQGGRIAIMAPEGDIFDLIAGRYSQKMPNLGVFLRGHSGEDLRVDRVGRKSEFVRAAAITIGLTIQPETLRGFVATPQFDGRGLTARLLYAVPRSPVGHREVSPPPMPNAVDAAYRDHVLALLGLSSPGDGDPPQELRLEPEALQTFLDYQRWLEPQLAETGELGSISSWAGKLMGGIGRIAGVLHVAEHVRHPAPWTIPIGSDTVSCALVIGDYLIAHARVAYAEMAADGELTGARYLSQWLRDHDVREITKRELFGRNRSRFRRVRDLDAVLEVLEECGYVRVRHEPEREGRGRPPSPTLLVNPLWLDG